MISQAILSFPSNPVILRFNLRFVPTCSHHSHQTIFPILYPATTTTSTSTTTFEIFGEPVAVREHPPDCWESQQLGVISYSHYSLKLSPLYLLHSSQRILIHMFCQIMTLSRDITPSRGAWLEYHRISMGWTVNSKFSVGEYLNYSRHRLWIWVRFCFFCRGLYPDHLWLQLFHHCALPWSLRTTRHHGVREGVGTAVGFGLKQLRWNVLQRMQLKQLKLSVPQY